MVSLKFSAVALLALRAVGVYAADAEEPLDSPPVTPNLAVEVSTAFPEAEIFGVKLVNGRPTKALLDFTNNEPEAIQIAFIGGALITTQPLPPNTPAWGGVVRNLTSTRYDVEIPAGQRASLPYNFVTDLNPAELKLNLVAVLANQKGQIYQIQAYNETVSVVEAATSFFDPQIIFLYLIIAGVFGGTLYFVYKTWIEALFPQTKRGGKGGERAKRSSGGSKAAVPPKDQVSVIGADGPAVTTGALAQKAYDESWIPDSHINRPKAKRVQSGKSAVKTKIVGE